VKTLDQYLEKQFATDPTFRSEFDRIMRAREAVSELVNRRKVAGISQEELARQLGISQSRLSTLERDEMIYSKKLQAEYNRALKTLEKEMKVRAVGDYEPRTEVLTIRVSKAEKQRLVELAGDKRSLADYIRRASLRPASKKR
jgi:transcriptional regulator with XRE-family HTH domain